MFAAPRNTEQVRNTKKNVRRRNGGMDTLSMLQLSADDHNDCRYNYCNVTLLWCPKRTMSAFFTVFPNWELPWLCLGSSWHLQTSSWSTASQKWLPKGLFKAFKSEKYKILIGYDTQFNITNGYVRQYNYYLNHHYRRHCHRHHCRHHHHHIGYFQVSWLCITDPRYTHAVSGASMILPLFQVLTFFG